MSDDLVGQLRRKLNYAARMLKQVTIERDIAQQTLDEAEEAYDHLWTEREKLLRRVAELEGKQ